MNKVIAWIKANPISVGAALVAILSIGGFAYVFLMAGSFTEKVEQRTRYFGEISSLTSKTVSLPADNPDGKPTDIRNIAINDNIIEEMTDLYARIAEQSEAVSSTAIRINRPDRRELIEGLFPRPTRTPDLPFTARRVYLAEFPNMLTPYRDGGDPARLNAGSPPDPSEIQEELMTLEDEFRDQHLGTNDADRFDDDRRRPVATGDPRFEVRREVQAVPMGRDQELSEELTLELHGEKQQLILEAIQDRAENIHIYADVSSPLNSESYPFDIRQDVLSTEGAPTEDMIWEAQLELWIQKDIVRAIALINDVDKNNANVITAPVKRLIKIDVVPGYVGIHTLGALNPGLVSGGAAAAPMPTQPMPGQPMPGQPMGGGGMPTAALQGIYSPPGHAYPTNPDRRLPPAFNMSPAGRTSNALYDVRHAELAIIADVQRLPQLIDALAKINFMTVLDMNIEDIDEFEHLKQGYLYGLGDMAKVTLTIETIWLREWTQPKMPATVKSYLGIVETP